MTAVNRRHIEVFVSSSFSHESARDLIKKTLEQDNATECSDDMPPVYFTGHLHEKDGYINLNSGVSSQDLINAYSEKCNAFILYAGNKIGEFTVAEFENVIAHAQRNYHFIFVVYNPEDIITEQEGTNYITWEEFLKTHLKRPDGVEYYHKQTTDKDLADTIAAIRNEIASKVIVPLFPKDMDYGRMLTTLQQEYRDSGTFYLPREIDTQVMDFLNNTDSLFGLVTGMSLAGKTRVVIENLKHLKSGNVRIHYLSGDSEAFRVVKELNFKLQFPKGQRHILFADDIDQSFFATQETTARFIELCQFAADNRGMLTIIGTTVKSFDDIMTDDINRNANAASWTARCEELPIKPMTKSEVFLEVRKLRALNRIEKFDSKDIREGMPLGALFVDMKRLRNIYQSLKKPLLFDAIKTLWLWKKRGRNDAYILLDFINDSYGLKRKKDDLELFKLLKELSPLVYVRGEEFSYTYETEEIVVDQIFKFSSEVPGVSSEDAYRKAVDRIIGFIDMAMPDRRFWEFSKLCLRLYSNPARAYLFDYAVDSIKRLYPTEQLTDKTEEIRMADANSLNAVHRWVTMVVKQAIRQGDKAEARRLYSLFPTDDILAELLDDESNRNYYMAEVFPKGLVADKYASTKSHSLFRRLLLMADFNESLHIFSQADFESMAYAITVEETFNKDNFNSTLRKKIGDCINIILGKTTSYIAFKDVVLDYIRAKRDALKGMGFPPLFESDAEMLLDFIGRSAWQSFSSKITSYDLPSVFDMVLAVKIPAGKNSENMALNKTFILNKLMEPMSAPKAFEAWLRMKGLKDSYTLMNIISKCSDFSMAYGFVESFMDEVGKDRIRLGNLFANKLLDTVTTEAELVACEKLYRDLGILTEKQIQEAGEAGIPALCVLRDEATYVPLLSKEFISLETYHKVLRYMKENRYEHSYNLMTNIISRTKKFSEAYDIVYGDCDFISEESRKLMRIDPVVISLLVRKARSEADLRIIRGMIDRLIEEAVKAPEEGNGILDPHYNILSEYLKNQGLASDYDTALAFLKEIEDRTGVHLDSHYIDKPLSYLIWTSNPNATKTQKISQTNGLILSHTGIPRKALRSLTNVRYAEGKNTSNGKISIPDIYSTEEFPSIDTKGNWQLKEMTRMEFLINMMEHRFAHPLNLQFSLLQLAADSGINPGAFSKAKKDCHRIIDLAAKTSLYLNFDSYVNVRGALRRFNDPKLEEKLFAISTGYSIMKDVCHNLHKGRISYADAMCRIKALEEKYRIRLYFTTAFYDAVIHRQTLDEKETVESITRFRDEHFPAETAWSDEQIYFLLHKTRSLEDLERIRATCGELPDTWPTVLLKVVKDSCYNKWFKLPELKRILNYMQEELTPELRQLYWQKDGFRNKETYMHNCENLYNKYHTVSPEDKRLEHLHTLASICWEIIRED